MTRSESGRVRTPNGKLEGPRLRAFSVSGRWDSNPRQLAWGRRAEGVDTRDMDHYDRTQPCGLLSRAAGSPHGTVARYQQVCRMSVARVTPGVAHVCGAVDFGQPGGQDCPCPGRLSSSPWSVSSSWFRLAAEVPTKTSGANEPHYHDGRYHDCRAASRTGAGHRRIVGAARALPRPALLGGLVVRQMTDSERAHWDDQSAASDRKASPEQRTRRDAAKKNKLARDKRDRDKRNS